MKRPPIVPIIRVSFLCAALIACADAGPIEPGGEAPPVVPPVVPPTVVPPVTPPVPPRGPPRVTTVDSIYVAKADGSDIVALTVGTSPAWSPDGRQLVFSRVGPLPKGASRLDYSRTAGEIYIMEADGSNAKLLTTGLSPSWSPDGKRIVFESKDGISVINTDGSGLKTLISHRFRTDVVAEFDMGVTDPEFSPDGRRIVFGHQGDGETEPGQIFLMNADGSNPVRFSRGSGIRWAEGDPSWSPEGSRIVFVSGGYGIVSQDVNSGDWSTVYHNVPQAFGSGPTWSPDGKTIVFTVDQLYNPAIWIAATVGAELRRLIPNGYDPTWSPDRNRIAFVRGW